MQQYGQEATHISDSVLPFGTISEQLVTVKKCLQAKNNDPVRFAELQFSNDKSEAIMYSETNGIFLIYPTLMRFSKYVCTNVNTEFNAPLPTAKNEGIEQSPGIWIDRITSLVKVLNLIYTSAATLLVNILKQVYVSNPRYPRSYTTTTIGEGAFHAIALRRDGTVVGWGQMKTASAMFDIGGK